MKTETELKARAKRLRTAIATMLGQKISSAQAMELVAKEENYPTWDAAAGSYVGGGRDLTGHDKHGEKSALSILGYTGMYGMYVVARSGSGKHVQATGALLNNLAIGKRVFVFDRGGSYRKLVQVMGGTEIQLQRSDTYQETKYGDASLVLFEFDQLELSTWSGELPLLPGELGTESFVVIDETHSVRKAFPSIDQKFVQWVCDGAAFCVTGQTDEDIAAFIGVPGPTITMRLSRNDSLIQVRPGKHGSNGTSRPQQQPERGGTGRVE